MEGKFRLTNMRMPFFKYIVSIFIFFLPQLVVPQVVYPQTEFIGRSEIKYLKWGGLKNGWGDLYMLDNAKIEKGPLGRLDILLDDNSLIEDDNTDIILHFDRIEKDKIFFTSERYETGPMDIFPSENIQKFGGRSAGFLYHYNSIRIKPLASIVFIKGKSVQSFAIDFYLYPTSTYDEDTVFSWRVPVVEMGGEYTGIKAYFKNGKLVWLFENVFKNRDKGFEEMILEERIETPINEWHHHALYYDSQNGLLTLYFDGKENNLEWITSNRRESGSILAGEFSRYLAVPITIGESFLGYMDEFRISRGFPGFIIKDYREQGAIKSGVIELSHKGTRVVKLSWDSIEEKGTAVRMFCRISDSFFFPGDGESSNLYDETYLSSGEASGGGAGGPRWFQVKNGDEISENLTGKYLQWRAHLYGTNGIYTPYLLSLEMMLELDLPPQVPVLLKVNPVDGGVKLVWAKNKESDIRGYRIYYGESSKFYFGTGSDVGDSPVFAGDVNSTILRGLENEKVYFFSITAVDSTGQESGFSREMIARPSAVYISD
ncbi:MAG TPA: hypothetical protein ENI15_12260 [Spirochaetes bacterium]|nr:hypothetical protein [Spirochaetota bacterium]